MPYQNEDDPGLPKKIQDMPMGKRKQFVAAFNSAYQSCLDEDGTEGDCEGEAMRIGMAAVSERLRSWVNRLLEILGFSEPCQNCNQERAIKEVDTWDGSAANYPDTEAYCAACLIDVNSAAGRDTKAQSHCMLPVRGPGDGKDTYVKQAVHAAAGGHGISQVKKPDDVPQAAWDAALKSAANELKKAYGMMDEEAPDSVMKMMNRAVALSGVVDQVYPALIEALQDEYVWVNDAYMDGDGMFLLCSSKGKLYRVRIEVSDDNTVTAGMPEEVAIDFQPSMTPDMPGEPGSDSDYEDYGSIAVSLSRPLSNMIIRQEPGGRWRWTSISCVSVLNRAGEIDSTALFDSFVDYAERTGDYPIRQFYHAGEMFRTGKADFLARVGYTLITSGLYDDTPLARAEIAARNADPAYWGDSIGFTAEEPEMLRVQTDISIPVYKRGILREISTLPEGDACAWFTNFTNLEVTRMNARQFEAFVKLFGGDEEKAKKWIEENPDALNRQIVDGKMLARSTEPVIEPPVVPEQTSPAPAAVPPDTLEITDELLLAITERATGNIQGNLTILVEGLQANQAGIEELTRKITELTAALQAHSTRLGALEADKAETDRNRVLDMPQSKLTVTYRPRNGGAPETVEVEKPADRAKATLAKIPNSY